MQITRLYYLLAAATTIITAPLALRASTTSPELITNGNYESGSTGWSGTTTVIGSFTAQPAYEGAQCAFLGGKGSTTTQTLYQQVTIPSNAAMATLSFYLHIDTKETTTSKAYDKLAVSLQDNSGNTLTTLATYSNLNKGTGYTLQRFDVSSYMGQVVRVTFKMTEDSSLQTSFVLDCVSLVAPTSTTDNTAPTVSASESGTSGNIILSASASDDVGVTKVEWYIDDALVGSSSTSPYSISYDSTRILDGRHSLKAKAYDAAGNVGISMAVSFTITNDSASTLSDPIQNRIKSDLEYLASDTCAGRKTGTAGGSTAASYIAQKMEEMGLSPIKPGGLGGSTVYHHNWNYTGGIFSTKASGEPVWVWSLVPEGESMDEAAYRATTAYNLVGVIPGTDTTLKGEYVFVSAHYDHMGTASSGAIYRGADDNASGTAGLLEVARLLVNANPKRTIAFLAVSGEEQGILGSEAFLKNPPITLNTIKADINLDMIGRNPADCLHVMPAKTEGYVTTLVQDARNIAPDYGITLSAGIERYWQQSDHYSFGKRKIPCICFNTGDHNDLHRTTDTPDKITYPKLMVALKIVRDLTLKVANDASAPSTIDKSVWSTWTWGPYTGPGPYSSFMSDTVTTHENLHQGDAGPLAE